MLVVLAGAALALGVYLWSQSGQDAKRFALAGTWQRVAAPAPPPGSPPIEALLGDTLDIDAGTISWPRAGQPVNLPYHLESSGDRLILLADFDDDGKPDQAVLEVLPGGEAVALSFGRRYGRWQRAAAP